MAEGNIHVTGLNTQPRRGAPVEQGSPDRADGESRVMQMYRTALRNGDQDKARLIAEVSRLLGMGVGERTARDAAARPGAANMSRADELAAQRKHDEDYDRYKRALGLGADEDARNGLAAGGR